VLTFVPDFAEHVCGVGDPDFRAGKSRLQFGYGYALSPAGRAENGCTEGGYDDGLGVFCRVLLGEYGGDGENQIKK
jgi:hypothetical protein